MSVINDNPAWLDIRFDAPCVEMLEEARRLKKRFVTHRPRDSRGWRSICLHGLSAEATLDARQYGYVSEVEAPHDWTSIAQECPVTVDFLKRLPVRRFYRVRFVLLEPFGYIKPHRDTDRPGLGPINVALNQPDRCYLKFEEFGVVPFRAGAAMMLDVSRVHAVANFSTIDRYHMIVHSSIRRADPFWTERLPSTG